MANVPIKTMKFPNLDNIYTIPQELSDLTGTVPVEQGGTNANTVQQAQINLGIMHYTVISTW